MDMATSTGTKLKNKKASWKLLTSEHQEFLKERFADGMTAKKMAKKMVKKGEGNIERVQRIEEKLLRKIEMAENPELKPPRHRQI